MKCPKCDKEMFKGFIPVHKGRVYWSPEDQRIPWNVAKLPKGSVVLSDYTIMTPKKAEAYYCESCKIVIIPVKD